MGWNGVAKPVLVFNLATIFNQFAQYFFKSTNLFDY